MDNAGAPRVSRILIETKTVYVVATISTPPRYLVVKNGTPAWGTLKDAVATFSSPSQKSLGVELARLAKARPGVVPSRGTRISRVTVVPEITMGTNEA